MKVGARMVELVLYELILCSQWWLLRPIPLYIIANLMHFCQSHRRCWSFKNQSNISILTSHQGLQRARWIRAQPQLSGWWIITFLWCPVSVLTICMRKLRRIPLWQQLREHVVAPQRAPTRLTAQNGWWQQGIAEAPACLMHIQCLAQPPCSPRTHSDSFPNPHLLVLVHTV